MSAVEITGTPGAILCVSADSVAALDLLGVTLTAAAQPDWRVDIHIGDDTITAKPATTTDDHEEPA